MPLRPMSNKDGSQVTSYTDEWLQHAAKHPGKAQSVISGNKTDAGLIIFHNRLVVHRLIQVGQIATLETSHLVCIGTFDNQGQFTSQVGVMRDNEKRGQTTVSSVLHLISFLITLWSPRSTRCSSSSQLCFYLLGKSSITQNKITIG